MTERDKDVPEFVAVTPRGVEPTEHEPAATEDTESSAATPLEPEPTEPEAPQAEATEPEPAAEAGSAEAGSTEDGSAADAEPEARDGSTAPDPAAAAPEAEAQPDQPAATEAEAPATVPLRWTPPVLERPAAPTGTDAELPAAAAERDVEVSVRVAAEGMASALSGPADAATVDEPEAARSVGPLALLTAVCVVLAIAAGVLLAVTARSNSNHHAIAAARVAALDAAKRETALALTYNYQTLDADFQRAEAGMSREFRASYAKTASNEVAPLAQQTHAISTGTIAAAGVVSATATRARVLVFANQVVQNQRLNATSRLDRSVIDVRMVKEDGRWVVDDLQPF